MSIKDLFNKDYVSKIVSAKNLDSFAEDAESAGNVVISRKLATEFVPPIDFSSASNFTVYGSAEKYYSDAIKRIYLQYPYDGSEREINDYHLSSSYLDRYIFDELYPRTTGYINLQSLKAGSRVAFDATTGYGAPATASYEYITIKGGPHTLLGSGDSLSDAFTGSHNSNNLLDLDKNRGSNLALNAASGSTVEFWLKHDTFDLTQTNKEVIFDLWNNELTSSHAYGRLRVELSGTTEATGSVFRLTYMSGASGMSNHSIGAGTLVNTASVFNDAWQHYAFTFISSSAALTARLYINGELNDTATTSSVIGEVTGAMIANIGALRTQPSGNAVEPGGPNIGWGKLAGSMDEFRYWKTERTAEQVGRNWFTQVGGGTNTDDANTNLGVYYKFNEGITTDSSIDSTVLDYSGRVSNGVWTGYNTTLSRNTGSAMVSASAATQEFLDPIIYSTHADVNNLLTRLEASGSVYDYENNASLINSLPAWILEAEPTSDLKNLTQIVASYFDKLQNQIKFLPSLKNKEYLSGSYDASTVSSNLVESSGMFTPNIFIDANVMEIVRNRDEDRDYELPLEQVKNRIYKNIYNNLVYIYKSKGTEKAFRNLIHCYGVGEDLIKLNTYGNNITYEIKNNFKSSVVAKNVVDFNHPDRNEAIVYQATASSNSNSVAFISGCLGGESIHGSDYIPITLESSVIFPRQLDAAETTGSVVPSFTTSSIFGMHQAAADIEDTGWPAADYADIRVFATRPEQGSTDVRFELSSSVLAIPTLSSSLFKDVYDNNKWSLAVRIANDKYPLGDLVTGVSASGGTYSATPYRIEFYGVNTELDIIRDEFYVTGSITNIAALNLLRSAKRVYAGANRTNFTGSLINGSDVLISNVRYWNSYLDNNAIVAHARDVESAGTLNPLRSAFSTQTSVSGNYIPEIDTLALNWSFYNITGSDSSGEFVVDDYSSGSSDLQGRYGWFGNIVKAQHTGRGHAFPASSDDVLQRYYINVARQQQPEITQTSEMVKVLDNDDIYFTRDSRPVDFAFSVEKSMYQVISGEMIDLFATIVEFNNLIGDPINRYRQDYKLLEKARNLFFEDVENTPDLDKFIDFYKWIDASLSHFVRQLIPATADTGNNVKTIVESHVLERNKYWSKAPTLSSRRNALTASFIRPSGPRIRTSEILAPELAGEFLSAGSVAEGSSPSYWYTRARRDKAPLATGVTEVDNDRQSILEALQRSDYARQRPASISSGLASKRSSPPRSMHGGINYSSNKDRSFVYNATYPFGPVATSGTPLNVLLSDDRDVVDFANITSSNSPHETTKRFYSFKASFRREDETGLGAGVNNSTYTSVAKGELVMPFTLVSGNVLSGYNNHVLTNFKSGTVLANLHNDTFITNEIPMQGPFTNTHVGGHQSRHIKINRYDSTLDTPNKVDSRTTRPEAYKLLFGRTYGADSTMIGIVGPDYPDASAGAYPNADLTRAIRYRNVGAKRPLNIGNIKTTTSSVSMGNYEKNYQIVQAAGRSINNRLFVQNGGVSLPTLLEASSSTTNSYLNTRGIMQVGSSHLQRPGLRISGSVLEPDLNATKGYSVSMWVTSSVMDRQQTLYSFGGTNRPHHSAFFDVNEKLNFNATYTGDDAVWISDSAVMSGDDTSYHIAISYASGASAPQPTVYVNGAAVAGSFTTTPVGVLDQITDANSSIGVQYNGATAARINGSSFQGTISEFILFNKNLTGDELLELYAPSGSFLPGPQDPRNHSEAGALVAWLRMGEGSGDSVSVAPYLINDQIGTLHGTASEGRAHMELIYHSSSYLSVAGGGAPVTNTRVGLPATTNVHTLLAVRANKGTSGGNYFGHHTSTPAELSNRFSGSANDIESTVYTILTRSSDSNDSIFVNRFSAPGGPEVNSLGYLDIISEEKSVYNALPFRNLSVLGSGSGEPNPTIRVLDHLNKQRGLRTVLSDRAGQFGYDITHGSVPTLTYITSPSYHKVNRNTSRRITFLGTLGREDNSHITGATFDNANAQYSIPRSDLQYSWITSSFSSSLIYGHSYGDGFVSSSGAGIEQGITFFSASNSLFDIDPGSKFTEYPVDFVGLNSVIHEPLDLVNNIASASADGSYLNPQGTRSVLLNGVWTLNGLLLHRNGGYGVNTWKQIRNGEKALSRALRRKNIISFVLKRDYNYPINAVSSSVRPRFGGITNYTEAPVVSKYKPLVQNVVINKLTPDGRLVDAPVRIRTSYANNLAAFHNPTLNNSYHIRQDYRQPYDKIKELYLDNQLQNPNSPVNRFESITYGETVYPAAINMYSSSVRVRQSYSNNFWRDDRVDRRVKDQIQEFGLLIPSQSMWPLDPDEDFSESTDYRSTIRVPAYRQTSTGSAGILQNNYSQIHSGTKSQLTAACYYARRHDIFTPRSNATPVGGLLYSIKGIQGFSFGQTYDDAIAAGKGFQEMFGGQTAWEVPEQSGKTPWYNSYDDYVNEMRSLGKDYSILPEFRMSDHIAYYTTTAQQNFLASNSKFLILTGGTDGRSRGDQDNFYKTYTNSDFLRFFELVKEDHQEIASPTSIKLRCKALMKFLPYDGFYPAERTVQLAEQFSASFGNFISSSGGDSGTNNLALRPILAPLFAPGIMFNSIKSGIAVDYPMFSASLGVAAAPSSITNTNTISGSGPVSSTGRGRFHYRVPFESLVEPSRYIGGLDMVDLEVNNSSSINVTSSWGGEGDDLYRMMAHNFFAEVPEFFLPETQFTSLVSKPDKEFGSVKSGNKYAARFKIFKSLNRPRAKSGSLNYLNPFLSVLDPDLVNLVETFTMYSRPSAFGPPVGSGFSGGTDDVKHSAMNGFAMPFTPPYYNGESWAEFIFTAPRDSTPDKPITLEDIFSPGNLSVNYKRIGDNYPTTLNPETILHHSNVEFNSMQVDASFNLFGKAQLKKATYDAATGEPTTVEDDTQSAWVIQPKFETPMLNFSGNLGELTLPQHGSSSCAFGMWHQYGQLPDSPDKGIFMQITDLPDNYVSYGLGGNPGLTGSLVDLVGFSTEPKRLGAVAPTKTIREAVVAVPFVQRGSTREFFQISREHINEAVVVSKRGETEETTVGRSIIDMVSAMDRYVFPPRFDFLTSPEDVEPFAMYIFEFDHTLNQQDLVDIWQNIPPRVGQAFDRDSETFKTGKDVGSEAVIREASVAHDLLASELLGPNLENKVQWMVFKVKQKAKKNYFEKVVGEQANPVGQFDRTLAIQVGREDSTRTFDPKYSYNWPYDFFSLVELVKLDAEVTVQADD